MDSDAQQGQPTQEAMGATSEFSRKWIRAVDRAGGYAKEAMLSAPHGLARVGRG